MQHDIRNHTDIEQLMRRFYSRVLRDHIIGFYFTEASAFDLEEHIPRICDFWEQQLFGKLGYTGRAFEAHADLHRHTAITSHHFHRWLYIFTYTVDEYFAGPTADAIKKRAGRIAASMQEGLKRFDTESASGPGVQSYNP